MKRAFFVSLVVTLALFCTLNAQEKAKPVSSSICGVTVFLSGAEIQRTGNLQLKAGAQQAIFENLPQNINPQSIQVSGMGNFTILGVSHRTNYLRQAQKTKEVKMLEDSLKLLTDKYAQLSASIDVLKSEQEMLKANQYVGGSQNGVKMADLTAFAEYFRTRLTDLTKRTVKANAEANDLQENINRINKQLNDMQQRPQTPTSEIVVDLTAPAATQATFAISYLVYNAGWIPNYDLRSTDIGNPIALTYKARVYQSTGEDWNNIKPVFSTGNPTVNSTKPTLNTWYLSAYTPPINVTRARGATLAKQAKTVNHEMIDMDITMTDEPLMMAGTASNYTTTNDSQTNVEFAVNVPYTIISDGKYNSVELANYTLPAIYEYYAVRKLERDVFLLAKVTGWESLNLMAGQVNLFFEGKYVGESHINTRQTDDTLALSLGRDNNITVTRERKRDFVQKQTLGSNITETREFELTVLNKKKQPVVITIEDQAPVSTDKEIKVDILNTSGAKYDEATGKLTWRYTLQPSESRTMTLKYSVKHPKNKTVILE
jgi:uncharacterized protein (TIGR02231 family)